MSHLRAFLGNAKVKSLRIVKRRYHAFSEYGQEEMYEENLLGGPQCGALVYRDNNYRYRRIVRIVLLGSLEARP